MNEFTEVNVSQINLEQHHYFYVKNNMVWEVPQVKGLVFENLKLGMYDDGELYQITSVDDYEVLKKRYPVENIKVA